MSLPVRQETGDIFAMPERMPGAPRFSGSGSQPGRIRHERRGCAVFGGLVGNSQAGATDVRDMVNLVPGGFPALVTGNARPLYLAVPSSAPSGAVPHGMVFHDGKLVFSLGTELYLSTACGISRRLGYAGDTDKRFASYGNLLFILPDKLVYDSSDDSLSPFTVDTGYLTNVTVESHQLLIDTGVLKTLGFHVGDGIRLDAKDNVASTALGGYYRISKLTETCLGVEGGFPVQGTFTVRVSRVMPDLDGICACGDRLYGFSGRTVYVCEAGNPWNWYRAASSVPDSTPFSLTTADGQSFTACTAWQGYPVLFKADGIVRVMGRATAAGKRVSVSDVMLSEQAGPGIPAGQASTLCELDGALYYCSNFEVYRYAGASPARVDDGLPEGLYGICAGTDGRSLFLTVRETNSAPRLYLYRPGRGWYRQEAVHMPAMLQRPAETAAGQGPVCLMQRSDGYIYVTRSFAPALTAGFLPSTVPTPDAMAEFGDETSLLPDGGRLLTVFVRAVGLTGSQMKVYVRYDGAGDWTLLSTVAGTGREELIRIPVPPRPCSWFRLKLSFSGAGVPGRPDGVFRVSGLWWDTEQGG